MARALVVEFQDDPNTWNIGSQWLLGDALLVAPIYDESNRRSVYLPTGAWTDWWSGEVVEGGRWIDVEVPLERMPLWIREGAIVPLGPLISYVGERLAGEITLRIAPFRSDGETRFTLRLDQGPVELVYRASNGAHELRAGAGAPNLALEVVGRDASPVNLVLM